MKKLLYFAFFGVFAFFIVFTTAFAHTIRWHVDDSVYTTTTCNSGDDITPPTAPAKYGYTFKEWEYMYTRIEYLESTGTQYIDTGKIPNEGTEAEIQFSNMNGACLLFGASNGNWANRNFGVNMDTSNGILFYMNCDGWTDRSAVNVTSGNIKLLLNGIYYNNEKLGITRGVIPSSSAFTTTRSLYVFAGNWSGNVYRSSFRLEYFKLWQNGTLVLDMIPVLDKNGTPCLYDKIENKFYYNAGTGDFVAGPII